MRRPRADLDAIGQRAPARASGVGRRRNFALAVVVLGAAVVLSGCNAPAFGQFRGSSTQGVDEFKLWVGMVIAGLIVAGMVWALIFYSLIKYRRKGEGTIPKQFTEHIPLEIIYTIVPIVIVLVIFYFTVVTENEVDAVSSHPAQVVNVTAFQWGWAFQYKGTKVNIFTSTEPGVASEAEVPTSPIYPQLVLPENETTEIDLFGNDVAHSLWVPAFNFSRMALPGHPNVFDFTPTQLGVFDGRCNQYCGLYHSEMLFSVKVVTPAQFAVWLSNEEKTATGATAPKLGKS